MKTKNKLWVVEACNTVDYYWWAKEDHTWNPVLGFSDGTLGVWKNREQARKAAKHMQTTNQYNNCGGRLVVRYRVRKYKQTPRY